MTPEQRAKEALKRAKFALQVRELKCIEDIHNEIDELRQLLYAAQIRITSLEERKHIFHRLVRAWRAFRSALKHD